MECGNPSRIVLLVIYWYYKVNVEGRIMRDCKIISVINWKGGVGKTTLTYHLAAGFQDDQISNGKYPRTLLIDLDPQCNLSISCLEANEFEKMVFKNNKKIHTVRDIIKEFLANNDPEIDINDYILKESVRSSPGYIYSFIDLIPSHPNLIYTDMYISNFDRNTKSEYDDSSLIINKNATVSNDYKFKIVANMLNKVKKEYDYVLIDCPPNLNFITQNALFASDYYVIPTILDRLSSYGIISVKNAIDNLNKSFSELQKDYKPTKLIGVIANNVREYGKGPKASQSNVLIEITNSIGDQMFDSYITYGDGIVRASTLAYPVFYLEDWHRNAAKQSEQIRKIIMELKLKIGV